MRLLADVNIEAAIVGWLRSEGHDVLWTVDFPPACPDATLLETARTDRRIILTRDQDFGELVFRRRLTSEGVILLRFDAALQSERLSLFQFHWPEIVERAQGHFLAVSDVRLRFRPLP